jgi:hypothetical protein
MNSLKVALVTQVLAIAASADGQRLRVTRIARGQYAGELVLDAQSLKPALATASPWLPGASLETGFKSRRRVWTVGEFGAGLFVRRLDGAAVKAPPPFNDPALSVTAFAISADEGLALVGNASGFVSVFDTRTGAERFAQRLHRGHVTAACMAPNGLTAYTGSATGELCATVLA